MNQYLQHYINDFNIIGLSLTNPVYDSLNIKDTFLELLPNEIFQYIKQLSIRKTKNFTCNSLNKYLRLLKFNNIRNIILQNNNEYYYLYNIESHFTSIEYIYTKIIIINEKFGENICNYQQPIYCYGDSNNTFRISYFGFNTNKGMSFDVNTVIIYELYEKSINSNIGKYIHNKLFGYTYKNEL